jgi:hypothetical protein
MTRRERLLQLIRQRNEALLAVPLAAAAVFPPGASVIVLTRKELVRGQVERIGPGGEVIVRTDHGTRECHLSDMLDWNPHAGETLADTI